MFLIKALCEDLDLSIIVVARNEHKAKTALINFEENYGEYDWDFTRVGTAFHGVEEGIMLIGGGA